MSQARAGMGKEFGMRFKGVSKWVVNISIIGVSMVLIGRHLFEHRQEFLSILDIGWRHQAALLLVYILIHTLAAVKTYVILHHLDIRGLTFARWFRIFCVSRLFNAFITQGANIYRSIKLKKDYGFSYTRSLGQIMVYSWFESVLITAILTGFFITLSFSSPVNKVYIYSAGAVLLVLALGPFMLEGLLTAVRPLRKVWPWLYDRSHQLVQMISTVIKRPALLLQMVGLGLGWFVICFIWINQCFIALGTPQTALYVTAFTVIILLSRTYNIVPGNFGVAELFAGYVAEALGGSMTEGIVAAGLLRVVEYVVVILIGVPYLRPSRDADIEAVLQAKKNGVGVEVVGNRPETRDKRQ